MLAEALTDGVQRGAFVAHDVWDLSLILAAQLHGLVQLYHAGRIELAESEFRSLCRRATGRILDGIRR